MVAWQVSIGLFLDVILATLMVMMVVTVVMTIVSIRPRFQVNVRAFRVICRRELCPVRMGKSIPKRKKGKQQQGQQSIQKIVSEDSYFIIIRRSSLPVQGQHLLNREAINQDSLSAIRSIKLAYLLERPLD